MPGAVAQPKGAAATAAAAVPHPPTSTPSRRVLVDSLSLQSPTATLSPDFNPDHLHAELFPGNSSWRLEAKLAEHKESPAEKECAVEADADAPMAGTGAPKGPPTAAAVAALSTAAAVPPGGIASPVVSAGAESFKAPSVPLHETQTQFDNTRFKLANTAGAGSVAGHVDAEAQARADAEAKPAWSTPVQTPSPSRGTGPQTVVEPVVLDDDDESLMNSILVGGADDL